MWLPLLALALAETPPADTDLLRALSARDLRFSCEELDALTDDPVQAYTHIVDTVAQPPWAPMRAAVCLIRGHGEVALPSLKRWVTDPATPGLARLVLLELDALPEQVAIETATAALRGPHIELARTKIARASRPAVRILAGSR